MKIFTELDDTEKLILKMISIHPLDIDDLIKQLNVIYPLLDDFDEGLKCYVNKHRSREIFEYNQLNFAKYEGFSKYEDQEQFFKTKINFLERLELIYSKFQDEFPLNYLGGKIQKVHLTDQGHSALERIKKNRKILIHSESNANKVVFIACAFGRTDIDDLCEKNIIPAIERQKFDFFRVDLDEPSYSITESIIENIHKSSIIIADLTYARQSVYFEIGFALGIGAQIILTCRQDHYRNNEDNLKVHFDLEQYKISFWRFENGKYLWANKMSPEDRLLKLPKK